MAAIFVEAGFHFFVDGFADEVEDVVFALDVFVEGSDGHACCGGHLAGGGLVEALFVEEGDDCVDDLLALGQDECVILHVGGDGALVFVL